MRNMYVKFMEKYLSPLIFHFSSRKGFTLVELMVVLSVTAILGTLGIAGFNNYNRFQIIQNAASDLVTTFNTARSRAQSQVKLGSSCNGDSQMLEGYSVDISVAEKSYTLKSHCSGVASDISKNNLPDNVSFKNVSTTSFFFPVITGGVRDAGSVTISGYGIEKNVVVNPLAGISMQLTPTIFPTSTPTPAPLPTSTPFPTATPTPTPTSTPTPLPTATPTPKPAQIPIKDNIAIASISQQGGGQGYTQGYRFSPNVNGKIVALWDYSTCNYPNCASEYGQKYVRLWADNGSLLAAVGLYNGGWKRAAISSPISVSAGNWYRVSTYLPTYPNGWGWAFWGYYAGATFPLTYGNINISTSYHQAGNVFPQTTVGANFYGLADIEFVPD